MRGTTEAGKLRAPSGVRLPYASRKSQAALEYLVTYGWAILAIVIVAAVLWYIGFFNPQQFANPKGKQCGGFSTVQCIDYTARAPDSVSIVFGNAAGSNIQDVRATILGFAVLCSAAVSQQGQFTCSVGGLAFGPTDDIPVEVSYTSSMSGLVHTETGFVRAE